MSDSSNREQNYWPGFVDALSNVVLTLVFVLVVFVFALVITSTKVGQKASEFVEQRRQETVEARQKISELKGDLAVETMDVGELAMVEADLQAKLAAAKAEAQATRSEISKTQKELEQVKRQAEEQERAYTPSVVEQKVELSVEEKAQKAAAGDGSLNNETNAIVVIYPRGIYLMNDKAKSELSKALGRYRDTLAGGKVVLSGVMGPETFSEARRMAYYRALDVRNFLLDRRMSDQGRITITTKQGKGNDDGRVELRIVRP